jgi:hypothetical protein
MRALYELPVIRSNPRRCRRGRCMRRRKPVNVPERVRFAVFGTRPAYDRLWLALGLAVQPELYYNPSFLSCRVVNVTGYIEPAPVRFISSKAP